MYALLFLLQAILRSEPSDASLVIYHTGDNALPWPDLPNEEHKMELPESY